MNEGEYTDLSKALDTYTAEAEERVTSIKGQENDEVFCIEDIHRADTYALSFLAKYYIGDYIEGCTCKTFDTYNYDAATGKLLAIEDVLTDTSQVDEIIKAQFEKYYSDQTLDDNYFKEYISENGYKWVVSYQGITFYFPSEVIGEKEKMPIPVTILFTEKPELFKENAKAVPKAYVMDMENDCRYLIDTDGNGECEKVEIFYNLENQDTITSAELKINDNKSVAKMYDTYYNKDSRSFFVHTASEENYILVYSRGSMDITGTYVSFDLSVDNQKIDYEESIYLGNARITDPYKIRIEKSDFVTGLTSCYGIRKLNEKGIIVDDSKEIVYTYDDTYAKAEQDIEAKKVDEQTGESTDESVMIYEEDKVQMISSDQHTWCIVKTEDGKLAKVTFEGSYGAEINGRIAFNIARE